MVRRVVLIGVLSLMGLSGCGNPGGMSDLEYTAKLRNEREEWEVRRARQWEAAERAIQEEQARQRERRGR